MKQASDITKFVEAQQGKAMRPALLRTRRFLAHDRHVLRFWAVWSDPGLHGERRPFIVHFFRADGTLEVLEVKQPNSGRDPFPALVKRVHLPKQAVHANQAQIGADEAVHVDSDDFYSEKDFRIGGSVNVFGRELVLINTDNYTRDFYKRQYGHQERLRAAAGNEPDGYESHPIACNALPLRFEAVLTTKRPEDRDRRFVVTFFKDDSTVAIFETKVLSIVSAAWEQTVNVCLQVRNSGFVGGKFLERTFLSDVTSEMFYIGSELKLNGFPFHLFPAANIDVVEEKLRAQLQRLGEMTSALLSEAKAIADKNAIGTSDHVSTPPKRNVQMSLTEIHSLIAKLQSRIACFHEVSQSLIPRRVRTTENPPRIGDLECLLLQ